MYLRVYLAQGSTAVLVGALATSTDLNTAVLIATPIITALCVGVGIAATRAKHD